MKRWSRKKKVFRNADLQDLATGSRDPKAELGSIAKLVHDSSNLSVK